MSRGRCAGCGDIGPEAEVREHVMCCPDFAAFVRENPGSVLTPALEYQRWKAADKAAEQTARIETKRADTDTRRAVMADRFRTRDILEDSDGD